tara:strand:- start:459 stop:752 length:294 start_codon:yes stop_codon:yes gene_type:complete
VSYSRWINSDFYTFWCGSRAKKREDEIFMCMYSLVSQAELCYTEVQEIIKNPELMREKITDDLDEEDIQELLSYMGQFIADVDQHYFNKLSNVRGGQ